MSIGENTIVHKNPSAPAPSFIARLDSYSRSLKVKEVADLFRITPGAVYKLVARNAIPSFKFGGSLLFDPGALADFVRRRAAQGK